MEKRLSVCGLCGDSCFVDLHMEHGQVCRVTAAEGYPHIKGNLCVRGAALKTQLHHPQRLTTPLRRVGEKGSGQFEPISWDEAFALMAQRLTAVKEESGAESTVFYSGHPKWYRYVMSELAIEYGTPNYCTESSACHSSPWIAYALNYGCPVKPPDIKNCRTLFCWGANPAWSKRSAGEMFRLRERGGHLVVVDPRKTPMSERADLHLAIRPGTDGALALAMAHVMFREGWEDKDFLAQYAHGLDEYKACCAAFPPEKAAEICGLAAENIVTAARLMACEGPAAIFTTSCGMAHSPNSVQNQRAVFLLEAITGNFDRPGGNHGPVGKTVRLNGFQHAARERVNVAKEFTAGRYGVWNRCIPNEGQAMGLDKAILNGEPYQIRNLIAFGMNHRMFPRADRMAEALKACEFYVDVDMFLTDSAKYADLVLPAQLMPEREYVHLLGQRVVYQPRSLAPGDKRNDVEILLGLCKALGLQGPVTGLKDFDAYMDWMLRPTGVTLDELKAAPEGLLIRCWQEGRLHSYERGLNTPSGKVEFLSEILKEHPAFDALPTYREWQEQNPDSAAYPFHLCTGPRKPWLFHSRTYRLPWLAGLEPHPLAAIHSQDAARLGIGEGDRVLVTTPVGSMPFVAEVNDNAPPGMITIYHDDESDNINDIISADYLDPISGFPGFRTYFCRVEKEEV